MPNHITINGHSYSSIEQMPPDVRRQYESTLLRLSENSVTQITTSRIVVNGKEYARWEDVPPGARAGLQSAGIGPDMHFPTDPKHIPDGAVLNYKSAFTITLNLGTLIVLLIIALVVGIGIGIAIGYKLH